jgi:hypothetical protein
MFFLPRTLSRAASDHRRPALRASYSSSPLVRIYLASPNTMHQQLSQLSIAASACQAINTASRVRAVAESRPSFLSCASCPAVCAGGSFGQTRCRTTHNHIPTAAAGTELSVLISAMHHVPVFLSNRQHDCSRLHSPRYSCTPAQPRHGFGNPKPANPKRLALNSPSNIAMRTRRASTSIHYCSGQNRIEVVANVGGLAGMEGTKCWMEKASDHGHRRFNAICTCFCQCVPSFDSGRTALCPRPRTGLRTQIYHLQDLRLNLFCILRSHKQEL